MKPTLFCDTIARFASDGTVHLMNKPFPRYGWSTQSRSYPSLQALVDAYDIEVGRTCHVDKHGPYVDVFALGHTLPGRVS